MRWNKKYTRGLGRAALAALAAVTITGCFAQPASPITAPTTAPTGAATVTAPTTGVPTTGVPTTGVPTTGVPTTGVPTTGVPTTGVPTAQPRPDPSRGLVGPEWIVAAAGDFDRNGAFDVVAYKPQASIVPAFTPEASDRAYVISELVVVEQRADGSPWVRLAVSLDAISVDGQAQGRFGSGAARPAAHLLRMLGANRQLAISPLNSAGQQIAQEVAVGYVDAARAYAVYGPGGTLPFPLVGPEWKVAIGGSMTPGVRDGVIAFKPSPIILDSMGPSADFAVVASELVAVDRGADGGPRVRLAVTLDTISADGQVIGRFGSGAARPAGLLIRGSMGQRRITIAPLNGSGQQYAQEAAVVWDDAAKAYRMAAPGGQPNPLVGAEWTVAVSGDFNGNGLEDVVAYKPAAVQPNAGGNPGGAFKLAVRELVVAERRADGGVAVRLWVDTGSVRIDGNPIHVFSPAGAGVLAQSNGGGQIELLPYDGAGSIIPSDVTVGWSPEISGFRVIPKLPADPLYVGPDWTVLARGDVNGDGLLDGVQFLPLSIQLAPSAGVFAGYVTAREALIIQVDKYNERHLMASVAGDSAVINGQTVYQFGDGSPAQIPAGYLVGSGGAAAMTVIPLAADGSIAGPALDFIWDAASGSYRVEKRVVS